MMNVPAVAMKTNNRGEAMDMVYVYMRVYSMRRRPFQLRRHVNDAVLY